MGLYDLSAKLPGGGEQPLADYKGKVLLIVNTASKCGFTPQYEGLEELYRDYKDRGFEVLGFPCNQFGAQEPGNAEEIANFCSLTYDVTFPLMAKIDVNGSNADPIFKHLKDEQTGLLGSGIKWNFTKFLVDRDGKVVSRHAPTTKPEQLRKEIEELLG
ncbi:MULTISPECIES: glutathione peroxidase [unclassified Sphingopyxis]|jgi:glutathione peroxidase|uniref:glutathione peroxidase n=1 Tax=unclassified Sphingopyxis TaxID=2614943 RepID=UPI0007308FF9|nr:MULTISPECIES: glutathione peroxidase [unclassified Sphingopyxis]MBD3733188.1 glutathione peroxidase [Sphingopyxis sp.]KTE25420.1 glutathione peroxidase [Sphingopyxis sp. H057]KTE53441.1 glutathione peroxidase [Sphingopyxis sp. H073]KTE56031.1 glutathione peroxidase [Sphingopyxis sp. H071]KTE62854.1 glutathione peroxidase [Sphingopyxis sp. H107]